MNRQENGITWIIREGVRYPLFDIEHTTLPNFLPNPSKPSSTVGEENDLWKQAQIIYFSLKDPKLIQTL